MEVSKQESHVNNLIIRPEIHDISLQATENLKCLFHILIAKHLNSKYSSAFCRVRKENSHKQACNTCNVSPSGRTGESVRIFVKFNTDKF